MQRIWKTAWMAALITLFLSGIPAGTGAQEVHTDEHEPNSTGFRVTRWANWLFLSYLQDETDDNETWGIELESRLTLSQYEVKNISYFEINQYERGVPGQPPGNPSPGVKPANGIGDLLTAFWISKRGAHHGAHHFAPGLALFELFRVLASVTPAASSMREIRSVGWAPLAIHSWTRSTFIFTRSSESFGRSGL